MWAWVPPLYSRWDSPLANWQMFAFHCGTPRFKFGLLDLCEIEEFLSQQEHKCSIAVLQVFSQITQSKQISPVAGFCVVALPSASMPGTPSDCTQQVILYFRFFLIFPHIALLCLNFKAVWEPTTVQIIVGVEKQNTEVMLNLRSDTTFL